MSDIKQNYQAILTRIRNAETAYGIAPDSVKLVAVSKTHPIEKIQTIFDCGQTAFGENYLQEAVEKMQAAAACQTQNGKTLHDSIEWHYIGGIQSNKTAQIAEHFNWVHSVDRIKIARRLSEQRQESQPPLNIFLQVNIEKEQSKSGFSEEALLDSLDELRQFSNLNIVGLMAIPKAHDSEEKQREVFARVRRLNEQCQKIIPAMQSLSMGMTDDLEAAIAEGATHVRVGTAIFGARDYS